MNDVIRIRGGHPLKGEVRISSSKNATVAILPAVVMASEIVRLYDVPAIRDVDMLVDLLESLNIHIFSRKDSLTIDPTEIVNAPLVSDSVRKLRASYYFMGALLGRFKKVKMLYPGGCNLGPRPIDLHLKGFEALGAKVETYDDMIEITADELIGNEIFLDIASVGATINIMLAAVFATGRTVISNAAKEPEIVDLSSMLNKMGAHIRGAGTSEIKIDGVKRLKGCIHDIIPDRIEAGTYIVMGAAVGQGVKVTNVIPQHIESLLLKLEEMGVNMEVGPDYVNVLSRKEVLDPVFVKTLTFPGFATDLQQPLTALLTQAGGDSKVVETIYRERFKHCEQLNKMGANIEVFDGYSLTHGPTVLRGAEVEATDLRCGAGLVVAALMAEGVTSISNAYHIYRGYDSIAEKLKALGAEVLD